MSLDFPNRKQWLKRRATKKSVHGIFMGWRHVAVWWEERTTKARDERGRPIEQTSTGPWARTCVLGRNALKAKLGFGGARKRLRRIVQRQSFLDKRADVMISKLARGAT